MQPSLNQNILFLAILLLLIIIGMVSWLNHKHEKFFFWLVLIFFSGAILAVAGLLVNQRAFSLAGDANPMLPVNFFQVLMFFCWILAGILFSKAFNPRMNQIQRLILGFALSFPVTTIAGNFLYELILY